MKRTVLAQSENVKIVCIRLTDIDGRVFEVWEDLNRVGVYADLSNAIEAMDALINAEWSTVK